MFNARQRGLCCAALALAACSLAAFVSGASLAGAASAAVPFQLDGLDFFQFGAPADLCCGPAGAPATGYVRITNNGASTFVGNAGFRAMSGFGENLDSSYPVTLEPGDHLSFSIDADSGNHCGYNGPCASLGPPHSGAEFFMRGAVSLDGETQAVNLSIFDGDIHSGVPRAGPYPFGGTSDNYILQGGDELGRVTGDDFGVTQAPGDFSLDLTHSTEAAPSFVSPTPACGSTIHASLGSAVTFTVKASDADFGDIVTLTAAGLPAGASMTPGLPASGNPVNSDFSWTPDAAGTATVSFTATDIAGNHAQCSLTLSTSALLVSQTTSDIHNAGHQLVTAVDIHTTVHDFVTVTGQAGHPVPTGNVTIEWFADGTCTGAFAARSFPIGPLDTNGQFDATAFPFVLPSPGPHAARAHYVGDSVYAASDGPCEPFAVRQLTSQIRTEIHTESHQVVAAVPVGATVHDFVTVNGPVGQPVPGGWVMLAWFSNGDCSGTPTALTTPLSFQASLLDANGQLDATAFAFPVDAAGFRSFRAQYLSNPTSPLYAPSDGACSPLRVVDANIQITPNGVSRVGASQTFTAHVNVNDGSGSANAADGTAIGFTVDSGPGTFTSTNQCVIAGGSGSCTISLSSAVTGVSVVSAHTTLMVGGVALTRDTNGVGANSGPATKRWVNARIAITPDLTNVVGQPHAFTVTLLKDTGTGAFVAAPGEHVEVTLTDSNGANHTAPTGGCTNAGANTDASGQCTIIFTSPTAGRVTGHAVSMLSVSGSAPFTMQTDGVAPNSGDALKVFVDAYIETSPSVATSTVDTINTETARVFVNAGTGGDYVAAPDGTLVTFTLLPGSVGSFQGGNTCLTTGGACTIGSTSPKPGDDTMQASTTLAVADVVMTRTTETAAPGHANSGNAVEHWTAKANQTISFGALADKTFGAPDFIVSASASSSLPVSFAVSGSCTVSGTLVHITGAGSCTVTASQSGNANYKAAADVSQTFSITTATQLKPPTRCTVPKVVGKRLGAAKLAIKQRHCRTGKVGYAYSRKSKRGTVISQSRRPGRVLPANSKINLVVSRGRKR